MTSPTQAGEGVVTPRPSHEDLSAEVVRRMFGRDTAYLVLWGVQLLGAALLTPLISCVLDVTAFGQLAAANAVMQVLFVITGLGLAGALQRTYAQADGRDNARRLLTGLLAAALVLTLLVDLTGMRWAPLLGFDGYPDALRLAGLLGRRLVRYRGVPGVAEEPGPASRLRGRQPRPVAGCGAGGLSP